MHYLSRTTAPEVCGDTLKLFDMRVSDSLKALANINTPLNNVANQQISMPISQGGLGLKEASKVNEIAFLASAIQGNQKAPVLNMNLPHSIHLDNCQFATPFPLS